MATDGYQPLITALEEGRGYTLAGESGSGKSRLATLIGAAMAPEGVTTFFLSADQVRSTALGEWEAAAKLIKRASRASLLVLDDVGKSAPSHQNEEIIFAIVNERTMEMRPTIITTQYDPAALAGRFKDEQTATGFMRRIGPEFNEPVPLEPKDL